MPLITERSFLSWAEKLTHEHDEPFHEVLQTMGLAVSNGELSALFWEQPINFSDCYQGTATHLISIVLPRINDPEVFEYSFPGIKSALGDIMIKTADMDRWLRSRGVAIDEEPHSRETPADEPAALAGIETKSEAFKNWLAKTYPSRIPADQTAKTLKRAFQQETGIDISTTQLRRVVSRT